MRRRAKRDLITLGGVVAIIVGVVGTNTYMRLDTLKEKYEQIRRAFEEKQRSEGFIVMDWDKDMRPVKGRYATGATFTEELMAKNNQLVNLCGFMSPIDQFGTVTEFMLLPLPIVCYFCDAPPMRDVVRVRLSSKAKMVNDPVVISGRLELHEGSRQAFFYTIKDARWNDPFEPEEQTTDIEHQIHLQKGFEERLRGDKPELVPGQTVPTATP